MIRIENTHDGYADIYADEAEWAGLQAIVAHGVQTYDQNDLYLDMSAEEIVDLHREMQSHDDLPAPLEKHHVAGLLATVARSEGEEISGLSQEAHRGLIGQLGHYNMLDIFNSDPGAVRAIGQPPGFG